MEDKKEEKKLKKGDNPKGQGPCKPKKPKTEEEKEAQRAKAAEKKRLKKEQARLEEEKKKKEEEGITEESNEGNNEVKKNEGMDGKNDVKKESKKKEKKKEKEKEDKIEEKREDKIVGKKDDEINEKKIEKKTGKISEKEDINNKTKTNKKEKDSKKKKFYGLTSFEERNEESKNQLNQKGENDSSILSTNKIVEFLSKDVKYSIINEEIIKSLRNIFLSGSTKQTKNCLNLLNSIKLFVNSVEGDMFNICDEVSSLIEKIINLVSDISEKNSGLYNTCKFLRLLYEYLRSYPKEISKEIINDKIQYYIDKIIKQIDNYNIITDLIQDGDTILFFGKSKIFRKLLWNAKENQIKFNVIFADSPKRNQISSEIQFLSNLGIPIKYTYIKGVNNIMKDVTKVFIKADSMLANGDLMGRQGTSILALIAKTFNKSVYAFCPSFKFMDKIIISNNPKEKINKERCCNEMIFEYNITPSSFIKTVICENGYIHASSIPVYIRELEKRDKKYIDPDMKL